MNQTDMKHYPVTIDGETAYIGSANELAVALDVLQGHHDRAVLEQLREHLPDIMGGPQGLARTLVSLSPDDQMFLIDAMGARLAEVISEAKFLRDIFATMAEAEVERKVLDTLGGAGLKQLIRTAEELGEVLEWVYGECDRQAINLIGDAYLKHIICTASDLSLVLHSLDKDGKSDLIDRIGWKQASGLVRNGIDLAVLLRALPADLSERMLAGMTREQLVTLIGNAKDWQYVWDRIEPAERKLLADALGVSYAS
jgi:hypothetical protein